MIGSYLAGLVSERTGLSQADADAGVDETFTAIQQAGFRLARRPTRRERQLRSAPSLLRPRCSSLPLQRQRAPG